MPARQWLAEWLRTGPARHRPALRPSAWREDFNLRRERGGSARESRAVPFRRPASVPDCNERTPLTQSQELHRNWPGVDPELAGSQAVLYNARMSQSSIPAQVPGDLVPMPTMRPAILARRHAVSAGHYLASLAG